MLRGLILYTQDPKSTEFSQALAKALQGLGWQAELAAAEAAGSHPISTAQFQVVCVAAAFKGWWKPQLDPQLEPMLRRCSRLQGKKGAAFVPAKLGSGKALKLLMATMEAQGMIVEDFAAISSSRDAQAVAARIVKLGGRGL